MAHYWLIHASVLVRQRIPATALARFHRSWQLLRVCVSVHQPKYILHEKNIYICESNFFKITGIFFYQNQKTREEEREEEAAGMVTALSCKALTPPPLFSPKHGLISWLPGKALSRTSPNKRPLLQTDSYSSLPLTPPSTTTTNKRQCPKVFAEVNLPKSCAAWARREGGKVYR